MPIIRGLRVLYRCLLLVVFGALVFKLSVVCADTQPSAPHHKSKSSVAVACYFPGRAKDLSAPLYILPDR